MYVSLQLCISVCVSCVWICASVCVCAKGECMSIVCICLFAVRLCRHAYGYPTVTAWMHMCVSMHVSACITNDWIPLSAQASFCSLACSLCTVTTISSRAILTIHALLPLTTCFANAQLCPLLFLLKDSLSIQHHKWRLVQSSRKSAHYFHKYLLNLTSTETHVYTYMLVKCIFPSCDC